MNKPDPFNWMNYGDIDFLTYGGSLVKFTGDSFEVIDVVSDCNSKAGMVMQGLDISWSDIFNEDGSLTSKARKVAEFSDALDKETNELDPDHLMWLVTGWISYYGGSDYPVHCNNKTEVRKMLRNWGLGPCFIKSLNGR